MNIKKMLAVLLALVMVVAMAACSGGEEQTDPTTETTAATTEATTAPTEETTEATKPAAQIDVPQYKQPEPKVTLTEVATTDAQIDMFHYLPLAQGEDGEVYVYSLLSYKGEDLIGNTYHDFDYFSDGIAVGYDYSGEKPVCELVNTNTGEVLLSDGAAKIEQINDRFYYAIYATDKTENQDEAFIYFTEDWVSLSPDSDDVLYKGYGKVYDLEKAAFVEALTIENPGEEVQACGSTVCIEVDWGVFDLYLEDGTVLPGVEDLYLSDDHMMTYDYDAVTLYDCNFNEITVMEDAEPISEDVIYSDTFFGIMNDERMLGVVDANGNEIMPAQFYGISSYWNGYFVVYDEDFNYGIYDLSGAEVLPCEYDTIYGDSDEMTLRVSGKDDTDYAYLPGIGLVEAADFTNSDDVFYKYPEDGNYDEMEYLVYSTGESIVMKDSDEVGPALVCSEADGFVELINGETLMEGGYDEVWSTKEYVYVLKGDTWTIYQVQVEM